MRQASIRISGRFELTHQRYPFRASLRLRRIASSSSSGEADPPKVERVVLNALANEFDCGCDTGKQANHSLQQRWSRSPVGSFDHQGRGSGVGRGLGVTFGRGSGVGLPVAVGLAVGVAVTAGVALAVTVAVGVTVAVAVAVGVTVTVGVGVSVGDVVGVGEGDPTAERISTRPQPTTLFGGPGVPHCL